MKSGLTVSQSLNMIFAQMIQEREHPEPTRLQEIIPSADIGIIGYGIVGYALAYGFEHQSRGRDRIRWYDKYKKESKPLEEVAEKSDFIFLTLPTPMRADHSGIDLSIIEENVAALAPITDGTDKIVVIKSTVTPGTTARFASEYPNTRFAFNPEFLTEANYLEDFLNADRTVIGGDNDLTRRQLGALYRNRFPNSRIILTDPTSAETVKLAANAMLAAKVAMANQLHDYCESLGISWGEVSAMVGLDKRIGTNHIGVTSERGYGGKCFPKDMDNLIGDMNERGVAASIFEEVRAYNDRIRLVKDWEDIPFAVTKE